MKTDLRKSLRFNRLVQSFVAQGHTFEAALVKAELSL